MTNDMTRCGFAAGWPFSVVTIAIRTSNTLLSDEYGI
jgi:hypothetical protein